MPPVVCIVGKSKGVKVALIEALIKELKLKGLRVGTLKHHKHGDFEIDIEGKDTWNYAKAGADTVAISSSVRFAVIKNVEHEIEIDEICEKYFADCDVVLADGFTLSDKPRIIVADRIEDMENFSRGCRVVAVVGGTELRFDDVNAVAGSILSHISQRLKSKYICCMLGAAIGDALGKQNEGLSRKDILKKGYSRDYCNASAGCPSEKLMSGQYTDDTEQMLVLAQSLIDRRGFDAQDFARSIAKWGSQALNDPARKSLVGPSSAAAVAKLNAGISWEEAGSMLPSCGSAMRVAPIGLFYKDLDEIESKAVLSSIPTHRSKGAIAGAVAVAVGVRCALRDMECSEIMKEMSARASHHDADLGKKIELAFKRKDAEPDEVFAGLGTSYLAYETVPSAFYCFSRHFDAPERAIIEAVNAGGDTDSIACITGALCGALHGSFPDRWISGLENKERVMKIAEMIFELGCKK